MAEAASLEEGDAPCVRDLLLKHYRDPCLEVEGKLGRRSKDRFTAGISAEQFAALEARLCLGAPCLGLLPVGALPEAEVTVDRFHTLERAGRERGGRERGLQVRSSFACDASGCPRAEPYEVLRKSRLADCHIGRAGGEVAPPPHCLVDLRVSFSQETAVPLAAVDGAALVLERRKRRRTFEGHLWRVQLTHVVVGVGEREAFEVEVELRMEVVKPRLEGAASIEDEALSITRELVAALRGLTRWAAEIPMGKKRRRLEEFQAVEPALRAALEEPEVDAELRRCVREGRGALHKAKRYLCGVLKMRYASVDEVSLLRFAGKQVARALQGQKRSSLRLEDVAALSAERPAGA